MIDNDDNAEPAVTPEFISKACEATAAADTLSGGEDPLVGPIFQPKNPMQRTLLAQMNVARETMFYCLDHARMGDASPEIRVQEMQLALKFSKQLSDLYLVWDKLRQQELKYKDARRKDKMADLSDAYGDE